MRRAAWVLVMGVLVACAPAPPAPPPPATDLARDLAAKVTLDGVRTHLQALADIAKADNGNRADATPGYEASVDYVAKILRDSGFDVQTPEFERLDALAPGRPTLTVAGRDYAVDQASLLLQTPAGGITAPVLRPSKPAGCGKADYPATPTLARGGIAVVDDTGCSVVDKQNAATANGAAALVVVSAGGRNGSPRGLFDRGYFDRLTVPVAVVGADGGAALRRASTPVRLILDAKTVKVTTRNVLAQTRTGDVHNVVMVGAHLDSVPQGPGINDNGTGVAAILETALKLGSSPQVANAVRFAFWGAEEERLAGSLNYVFGRNREELNDIALYLNFDMLGSPNAGYFTYDGDQSGPVSRDVDAGDVPTGSGGVERTLAGYLNLAGKRPADMPLGVESDYSPFLRAGVPIGGMTTGAGQQKTNTQARLWGGKAAVAFDPSYHTAGDTLAAVNGDALAVMAAGVGFAVGTYATSIEGVNGVPAFGKRHRAAMGP